MNAKASSELRLHIQPATPYHHTCKIDLAFPKLDSHFRKEMDSMALIGVRAGRRRVASLEAWSRPLHVHKEYSKVINLESVQFPIRAIE